jgi:GT2 family glycosyltransferase
MPATQRTDVSTQRSKPIRRIAVLITCFNRRELTLASLAALYQQHGVEDLEMTVFLVDDASTDGTGDAVRGRFPQVKVLQGTGSLFWNGGMRRAFDAALQSGFDAYLWLNDDTIPYPDALQRVIECANWWLVNSKPAVVVGSVCSPGTGQHTYGGFLRRTRGPALSFTRLEPHPSLTLPCDTMNGNFTLIPRAVAQSIGNIERRFCHQFGDVDYGLRARSAGFHVVIAPGYVGECSEGSSAGTWRDPHATFARRWRHLTSVKGVPFSEWLLYTRRHYGWRWMHYAASPYLKTILSSLTSSTTRRPVPPAEPANS